MKKYLWVILWLVWVVSSGGSVPAFAAQSATTIEEMEIDIWPDYDQPSVLLLLTGTLPATTPLPATVTLSIPANATLHAVARMPDPQTMIDDITYNLDTANQLLTLTTPDLSFRIEYYQPYTANNLDRTYTFSWQAPTAVNQFLVTVQQPASATGITLSVNPISVMQGDNTLLYHNLPALSLAANQSYNLDLSYTMSSPTLTTSVLRDQGVINDPAFVPTQETNANSSVSTENWVLLSLLALGIITVSGVTWWLNRKPQQMVKKVPATPTQHRPFPPPQQTTSPNSGSIFCHHCGTPAASGDKFCRSCGTPLKVKK